MELSIKKLRNRIDRYFKENHKYAPSSLMFDMVDDDYIYLIIETHYVLRIPKSEVVDIIPVDKVDNIKVEPMIERIAEDKKLRDFRMGEVEQLRKDLKVVNFWDEDNNRVSINLKFFKQYINHNPVDNGVPSNIEFSGIDGVNPLIMWEDGEAVAMFLPIMR